MITLHVKNQYKVQIHWADYPVEFRTVLAINEFQAKDKVICGSGKGFYDSEQSRVDIVKYGVAVQRVGE